jgi:aerotaxis receptor
MNTVSPSTEEYELDENVMISQTDLDGVITYINKAFSKASGYDTNELIGAKHNIIRHPSMPKAVFEKLWSTVTGGRAWNGLIKNLRKDGQFYWVDIEILPTKDADETIIGFISVSKPASRKNIQENEEVYTKMLEAQN